MLSSVIPNAKSIGAVRFFRNDYDCLLSYYPNMAKAPQFDWYLKEWMGSLRVRQADVMKLTGYSKATMSELTNGKQRFNRDILNEVARALGVRPFELLMHPDDAMAIRQVRDSAARLATERVPTDAPEGKDSAFG